MAWLVEVLFWTFMFLSALQIVRRISPRRVLPGADRAVLTAGSARKRDLRERILEAGIDVIGKEDIRDLRLTDVGKLKIGPKYPDPCEICDGKRFMLFEIYGSGGTLAHAQKNRLGDVCASCGKYAWPIELGFPTMPPGRGRIAPLLQDAPNFFDVLDYLSHVHDGTPQAGVANADPAFLAARRDQLEAELNEIRLTIKKRELDAGATEPYRDGESVRQP
jgi:hypothetical protein